MPNLRDGRSDLPIFVYSEIDDLDISLKAFRVYAHLARRAGTNGACFPAYQSIGDCCFKKDYAKASTRKTLAIRAVKELVELRLLKKKTRMGPLGNQSNDYELSNKTEWLEWNHARKKEAEKPETVLSIKSEGVMGSHPRGDGGSPKGTPLSLTVSPIRDRESTVGGAGLDRTYGEAAKSKLLQGDHAATEVAYPDKVLSAPDLTDKPNEYIQPYVRPEFFEFEQPCQEEGSVPLREEFGQQEETIAPPITLNVQTIETIAPPEPETLDTTNQSPLVPKDRIKKERKIAPRSRQKSQYALNRAYTFDDAGWLQLPEANGRNSVARAIAVRAMQEILTTDHGESIDVFWEQDDEGNWLVLDAKHDCEAGSLDAMFGSKGRLTLGKLRDCCAGFSGVPQEEFNRDLQMLYEIALEFCEAGGVLGRLEYGERWIDQDLFAEYLENWL
jgi:hypothetical protein